MAQKVLVMSTYGNSLRSEAFGWSHEDGSEVNKAWCSHNLTEGSGGSVGKYPTPQQVPVGLIGRPLSEYSVCYPTVLHAIGAGWNLLAPPIKGELISLPNNKFCYEWEWWLVK